MLERTLPHDLIPFYLIRLIDIYWLQVIQTKAAVTGFSFFQSWTRYLLDGAPDLEENQTGDPPNIFCLAVEQMLESLKDNSSADEADPPDTWTVEKLQDNLDNLKNLLRNQYSRKVPSHFYETDDEEL